jgi:hypothetical protein
MRLRQPASAITAILLATAALLLVLGHAALYGIVRRPDEGAAAHVFQLLALLQLPFLVWFVLKHVRVAPRRAAPALLALAALWLCTVAAIVAFT